MLAGAAACRRRLMLQCGNADACMRRLPNIYQCRKTRYHRNLTAVTKLFSSERNRYWLGAMTWTAVIVMRKRKNDKCAVPSVAMTASITSQA